MNKWFRKAKHLGTALLQEALPEVTKVTGKRLLKTSPLAAKASEPKWLATKIYAKQIEKAKPIYRKLKTKLTHGRPQPMQDLQPWEGYARGHVILVVHDAHKAGLHIDVHLVCEKAGVQVSFVKNLRGRDHQIKLNNSGELTQKSKEWVEQLVQQEFSGRRWLGRSMDHNYEQATYQWKGSQYKDGYGSGPYRQVAAQWDAEFIRVGNAIEFYCAALDGSGQRVCYVYTCLPATSTRETSVLSLGIKQYEEPVLNDKLKLKFVQDRATFEKRIGKDAVVSLKEDGASTHFIMDKLGLRLFSPRSSKATGQQISYTRRLGSTMHTTSDVKWQGMAEIVMKRDGKVLSSGEIGGYLNSKQPIPDDVQVELVVYRIDQYGNLKGLHNEDYAINKLRIKEFVEQFKEKSSGTMVREPRWLSAKDLDEIEKDSRIEGAVAAPKGKPITDGYKWKPRGDELDVEIVRVEFGEGSKGGVTGVIWYRDPSDNKLHKTSSGLTHELKRAMATNPQAYEGRWMKVKPLRSADGHHRAVRVISIHQDK